MTKEHDSDGGLFETSLFDDEAQSVSETTEATSAPTTPEAADMSETTPVPELESAQGDDAGEPQEDDAQAGEGDAADDAKDAEPSEGALDAVSRAMAGGRDAEAESESLSLASYASRAYLEYAMSVVKSRALPFVSDGQKPVQRRILIDMLRMGLTHGNRVVKSARVVGDVLGKYHPHGDTAVYDALVRMAQDFSLRYPLVDGEGNFGSRDGDSQAAMRYTEARLMPIASLLLDEVDTGAVDFVPNYDGNFTEPVELPAKLPFLLLNGASGIAVGMSTEMPSHNLNEVAAAAALVTENPQVSLEDVMALLPGPDFPCGGSILAAPGVLSSLYERGRGRLTVQAKYHFEDLARGQWQLVIDELPPRSSSASVMAQIDAVTNPKPAAGKKSVTARQQQLKGAMLALIERVRDESGAGVPVRLVIEPKTSKVGREELLSALFAQTGLQDTVSYNFVMLGIDGRPRQKGLMEILREWSRFRLEAVRRRTAARLEKVEDRLHILEGRMTVFLNIERVIAIIREAEDPKAELMSAFGLSERQADDILEIRLRQLARLAGIAIEKEMAELEKEKGGLERILGSDAVLRQTVCREIRACAKAFGDERRTEIVAVEATEVERGAQKKAVAFVDEDVTVIITEKGFLRQRSGHGHDVSQQTTRVGDSVKRTIECRLSDTLTAVADNGRVYSIPVADLPGGRTDGQPLAAFIELEAGGEIQAWHVLQKEDVLYFVSTDGFGFTADAADVATRLRAGKVFAKPADGARLLKVGVKPAGATGFAVLTSDARLLVMPADAVEMRHAGGKGLMLVRMPDDVTVLDALYVCEPALKVNGVSARGAKRERERIVKPKEFALYESARARRGRVLPASWRPTSLARVPDLAGAPDDEEDEGAVTPPTDVSLPL